MKRPRASKAMTTVLLVLKFVVVITALGALATGLLIAMLVLLLVLGR